MWVITIIVLLPSFSNFDFHRDIRALMMVCYHTLISSPSSGDCISVWTDAFFGAICIQTVFRFAVTPGR